MIIALILLVGALCLISGWAARQMQADRENTATIEQQRLDLERLTRENEGLRRDVADHTGNLEMVLSELDTSA
jgi:hypothetical protein